jgi:methionyl-tRNA formyltransferase
MRIVFVTQEDPFYIQVFFETLFKNYGNLREIQGLVLCRTMGRSLWKLIKQMYGFYGPVDFLRVGTRYVKNKVLGILLKRVVSKTFFDIKHLCSHYNIEVIPCNNINDPAIIDRLNKMKLDVIVSVAAPHIFKKAILSVPKWGCINIHNAKLPKYRGMLPNFWNMFYDEKNSAITIHTMDLEIDKGKILLQREFEIQPEESLDQLIKRTKSLGALCLIEVLKGIREGTVQYKEPEKTEGSYFSFPTPSDVKKFRRMGKRLL